MSILRYQIRRSIFKEIPEHRSQKGKGIQTLQPIQLVQKEKTMIKINPNLIKDNREYSFDLKDSETGEVLKEAITLSGKDIKEILKHLFWSTTDAIKADKL